MNSYSQAGQDQFVHALHPSPGVFLDIGCAGRSISNTLALEEIGWSGVLVDNSVEAMKDSAGRKPTFVLADAVALDYSFLPPVVDYLSLDVDFASLAVLRRLPLHETRFRIITVEHDSYQHGETLRTPMLEILKTRGYDVLCADVCNPDPFEIWCVDPKLVDMSIAEKFRRNQPTQWRDILA